VKNLQEIGAAFAESGISAVAESATSMKSQFLSDLPSCPKTYSAALLTVSTPPLWMRPSSAVQMSGLPRCEVDRLIKEKLIQAAWRPNKYGKLHPLIYAPSLWNFLENLPQTGPAEEKEVVV
jgi:hypothetical protein